MSKIDTMAEMADFITKSGLIAGGVTIGLLTPGGARVILPIMDKLLQKQDERALLRKTLKYMKHRRYVRIIEESEDSIKIEITEAGRQRFLKRRFDSLSIQRQSEWDKKWRLVIFDIPETKKAARNALNFKLKQLGFYQLQKSAWAHPFPCRDEVDIIKEVYNISPYITYLETGQIDSHNHLTKYFRAQLP